MENKTFNKPNELDITYAILYQFFKRWAEKNLSSTEEDFFDTYKDKTLSFCYNATDNKEIDLYFRVHETEEILLIDTISLNLYLSDPKKFLLRVNMAISVALCAMDGLYGKMSSFRKQNKAFPFKEAILCFAESYMER